MVKLEAIIFIAFLADSLFANVASWCCAKWYKKKFKKFHKVLPLTKLWTAIYLILVLWVGYGLYRLNILF